jgi:ubiquinone/menaquinone biosynthesis C-methylase UbiE
MNDKPIGAGKSSFDLIDVQKFFSELNLQEGITFLDVACGRGAYSLAALKYVGVHGRILSVDLWEEGIEALQREVRARQIPNLTAHRVDVSQKIPMENQSVDVALLATVLHDLIQDHKDQGALSEIERVLKLAGRLAVVEFKKMEGPPGPPLPIRITSEDVMERLRPYSFELIKTTEVGPYNYLALFRKQNESF